MKLIRSLYFSYTFFIAILCIVVCFVLGFLVPILFIIAQLALLGLMGLLILECVMLFLNKKPIKAHREVANQMSLGDENKVSITAQHHYNFPVFVTVYDNAPYQLQLRNLHFSSLLLPGKQITWHYDVRPTERGAYEFSDMYFYVSALSNMIMRKVVIPAQKVSATYPSVLQMKKYELKVFAKNQITGIKKIRRLGHNNEFEQIKNYVQGDDIRTVNWKATSRKNELMVNQYQDEKSQHVYSIIDKSRSMRMPFNDLTLLDYAINSTLAFSNICLRKGDKVGLMTFSDKLGSKIAAERTANQLVRIIEILYRQKTRFLEANYELLFHGVRSLVKGRSLLMLYTNFDSEYALKRNLPLLKKINQQHVLVVIFFENTEIEKLVESEPKKISDIYLKTFAEKHKMDKKRIALELRKNGIQTVLTTPESLSIDTINKYLELKARGVI